MPDTILLKDISKSSQTFLDIYDDHKTGKLYFFTGIDNVNTFNNVESDSDRKSDRRNDFKIAMDAAYPKFKEDMLSNMAHITIESGVHYDFEDIFHDYFEKNPHMAAQMLQRLLREQYENVRLVKAILHLVSHYDYKDIGSDFTFPVLSLCKHQNKGIRKFALKVFDNWNSIETLFVLRGTEPMSEKWLNTYRETIIKRLERNSTDVISFTFN